MSYRGVYAALFGSLLVAMLLQLIALPELLAAARPLWVPLLLSYWALREPRLSTLFPAFVIGLAMDVLFNTVLGQHALGYIMVVYFVERLRGIFVLFPLWQATLALIPGWFLYAFLMFWIDGLTHHQSDSWLRWLPVLSTSLFWPLVYTVMELLRQRPEDE
ncbi:MAG TPA: rod shape-determining protein MreD [Solimonas sp.]|nr:rod shape-determining protein MreD [Solimonas sp.]